MKKLIFLSLTLLTILSCTSKEPEFPIGAWKLLSTEVYTDGNLTEKDLITYTNIKIFSEKNWEFLGMDTSDSLPIYNFGGGTYSLNGSEYLETIEMHVFKPFEGQTLKMTLGLKNDTLVQEWIPLDSTGIPDTHLKYVEKSVQLK